MLMCSFLVFVVLYNFLPHPKKINRRKQDGRFVLN